VVSKESLMFRMITYTEPPYKPVRSFSHKLGRYHPETFTAEQAKELARERFRHPEKAEARSMAGLFSEVCDEFETRYVDASALRSSYEVKRMLKRYVRPDFDHRELYAIRRVDVNILLDGIADRHGKVIADRTAAVLRKLFNWYQTRDGNFTSPMVAGMKRDLRTRQEKQRDRVLTDAELKAIWAQTGPFADMVKVLLLTGQRLGKVKRMRRQDILEQITTNDGNVYPGPLWKIETAPREKGNAGALKLNPLLVEILARQPEGRDDRIFPFDQPQWRKHNLDRDSGTSGWVLHDCRRTAKTLMQRARVLPHISEAVLGHAFGTSEVEGVYDRYPYYREMGEALEALAALIASIVGANVTSYPVKAA
jgi:integrase